MESCPSAREGALTRVRSMIPPVGPMSPCTRQGMSTPQIWVNHQPGQSKCLGGSMLTRLTFRTAESTRVNCLNRTREEPARVESAPNAPTPRPGSQGACGGTSTIVPLPAGRTCGRLPRKFRRVAPTPAPRFFRVRNRLTEVGSTLSTRPPPAAGGGNIPGEKRRIPRRAHRGAGPRGLPTRRIGWKLRAWEGV